MRISVNIGRDIENIVRSYSEIKQYFSHCATTQQLRDNHLLEFHLHNIEEKLLNIRNSLPQRWAIRCSLSGKRLVDMTIHLKCL